jgi:Protein of unknown function (DUF3558)
MHGPSPKSLLLGISVVTTIGVERWRETDVAADVRPDVVGGFPAYTVKPDQYNDYCSVDVDVAPGQLIDVQLGGGTAQAPIAQEELCLGAERSAEAVMTALIPG